MSAESVVADLVQKTADKPSPSDPPRLRIHHLLLWIAITAAWLVVIRLFGSSRMEPAVLQFLQLTNCLEMGVATAITLLGIFWKWRGRRFFDQPGQWLAVLPVLEPVFAALAFFVGMLIFRFAGARPEWLMKGVSLGCPIAMVCLFLAWKVGHSLLWRIFFILVAILSPLLFFAWLVPQLSITLDRAFLRWWLPLFILVIASIRDWRERDSRRLHWTHWAGIGIWLFGTLAAQASAILRIYPPSQWI